MSEPFNLPNTADREAAASHKERPQRPMTASSTQAQRPPPPSPLTALPPAPLVNRPLFLLERKGGGVRGNARNSSPSVGEAGSTHQSRAVSAPGGSPRGEAPQPPARGGGGDCSVGPRRRLGSISWTYLTWSPSKRCSETLTCVCAFKE